MKFKKKVKKLPNGGKAPKITEGGYDIKRANELGYMPDEDGHLPSRDYETGQYLKHKDYYTTPMSIINDELLGYKVRQDLNGNLYSIPREQQYPNFDLNNPPIREFKNGGKAPIKGTKEQYQAYQDSLNSYNATKQYENVFPIVSNEESDKITKLKTTPNHLGIMPIGWFKKPDLSFSPYYKKPVQPIIYQPEDTRVPQNNNGVMNVLESNKTPWGQRITEIPKGKKESDYQIKNYSYNGNGMWTYVPKEQPINLQSSKPDLLQGNNKQLEFNSVGFPKGSYFTREQQGQEIGGLEYFDKKTGKKLMENGGYNLLPQIFANGGYNTLPVDNTTVNKIYIDNSKKGYQSSIPKDKQDWYDKSSGRIEESISPLDIIPMGALNTGSRLINNAYKLYSKYNKFADFVNGYELYNDLNKIPENKTQKFTMGGNISRFEVPIQQAEGLDPFKLPYNEIATAMLSKQKSYDEQEAEMAKNQAFLADLKSGYRTAGLPQEIQSHYNDRFQNYIGKDLTDPTIKKSLVQDIANLKGDSRLRTLAADIKQSALWDNYQQAHPDLAGAAINPYKQGEQWIPARNPDETWQTEQQMGNWYGNIIPASDWQPMVNDAFSKVKENTKNKIIESDPTASFYTDKDGKDYYLSKKTGNKAVYITPDLPQWQSAANEQALLISQSKLPQANYFRGTFQENIKNDPNFIKNYISTAGGKFLFDRTEESEDYTIKPMPGSGSNSNNTKQDPTISKYPLSITTGQITDQDGNRITTPSQLSRILDKALGEDKDGNSNYDKSIGNIVNELQTNYGKEYPGLEFKQLTPGSTTITVTNTTGGDIPADVQTKVDAINNKNELVLQKLNGLKQVQKQIMQESGLEPNLTFDQNLKKIFGEKGLKEAEQQADKTLSNETVYYEDYTPNPKLSVEQNRNIAASQGKLKKRTPEKLESMREDFILSYLDSKKHPSIEKYKLKMDEVLNGIEMMNEDAIPIGESIKDNVKQNTLMINLTNALKDPVMLTDGQYIKYANRPDVKLQDSDKKIVEEFMKDPKRTDLKNITYLYFDQNENEYKVAVNIPRGDGSVIVAEVSPKAIKNLEQFAADVDSDFHGLKLQGYNNTFFRDLKETNGTFAFSPKVDGIEKRKMAKELGVDESKINDYQIGVKRVLHPIQIQQTSGEIYNLTPGSFYFTVPDAPNIIIKPSNAKSIFQFNQEYTRLKAKYGDNLSKEKIEELIRYINTGPGLGIESIHSSKDYSRLQTYPKITSPK